MNYPYFCLGIDNLLTSASEKMRSNASQKYQCLPTSTRQALPLSKLPRLKQVLAWEKALQKSASSEWIENKRRIIFLSKLRIVSQAGLNSSIDCMVKPSKFLIAVSSFGRESSDAAKT